MHAFQFDQWLSMTREVILNFKRVLSKSVNQWVFLVDVEKARTNVVYKKCYHSEKVFNRKNLKEKDIKEKLKF